MSETPDACECRTCTTGRRLKALAVTLSEDDAKWLLDLGMELAAAQMDRDYYEAIIEGDWPSSVSILERALERAKQKQSSEAF